MTLNLNQINLSDNVEELVSKLNDNFNIIAINNG